MDWYNNVFELIDMRSFSNLWFWIALAVIWSSTSHWVLGVPWDMVTRVRRDKDPDSLRDLEDMVRINTNRILFITRETGVLLAAFLGFVLTILCLLGFVYGNEFSQAMFLLGFPLSMVGLLSARTAQLIQDRGLCGDALIRRMGRHRLSTQIVGTVAIFVTAMWGMFQNMSASVLYN